jgi:hypothetical protein
MSLAQSDLVRNTDFELEMDLGISAIGGATVSYVWAAVKTTAPTVGYVWAAVKANAPTVSYVWAAVKSDEAVVSPVMTVAA